MALFATPGFVLLPRRHRDPARLGVVDAVDTGLHVRAGVPAQRGGHVNQRLIDRALRVGHLHEPFSNAARPAPSMLLADGTGLRRE